MRRYRTIRFNDPKLFSLLYSKLNNARSKNNKPTILLLKSEKDRLIVIREKDLNKLINPFEEFEAELEETFMDVLKDPLCEINLNEIEKELEESLNELIKKSKDEHLS
jgi:hypothetical protein